jgi:cytochrome c peroxidase
MIGKKHLIVIFLSIACIYACQKNIDAAIFEFKKPSNFPEPVYHFTTNPVTKEGFELGRKLFYDGILSRNNTISCGSCHIQTSAFTHHGHEVSHGIDDKLGTRNSPPVMNLAWSTSFMWDGGIVDLDLQPIAPISSHVEMDETIQHVVEKLNNDAVYPSLFKKAFGDEKVTTSSFLKALSQFVLMCNSSNSKYDSLKREEAGVSFTPDEQEGYNLFLQNCNACHAEPLFTDNSFRNNGIGIGFLVNDSGRYKITLNSNDLYKFKVPSLRNLAYTGPFMHDGRFISIDEVLEHYNSKVKISSTLDPLLQENGNIGIPLDNDKKRKIKAFLNTLNDRSFLLDKNLSEQ